MAVFGLAACVAGVLIRRYRNKALALVLERRFPELNDRLVTVVEFEGTPLAPNAPLTPCMLDRTVDDVVRASSRMEISDVFNTRPLRQFTGLAAALMVAIGAFAFVTLGGVDWLNSIGLLGSERQVRERIEGYWDARVEGDPAKISEFEHPDQKAAFNPGMLVTESYEILKLEVDGDNAVAEVALVTYIKHPLLLSCRDYRAVVEGLRFAPSNGEKRKQRWDRTCRYNARNRR